jgi:hypothetical protein
LQGGIAGPDDLVLVEPDDQLGGDEPRHHVAPHGLRGLLRELRQELGRPRPVAEQIGNPLALGVVLVLGDWLVLEGLAVEVAAQHEGAIVLDLTPSKRKKACLALK